MEFSLQLTIHIAPIDIICHLLHTSLLLPVTALVKLVLFTFYLNAQSYSFLIGKQM